MSGTLRRMVGLPGRSKRSQQQCTASPQSLSRLTSSAPRNICHKYCTLASSNFHLHSTSAARLSFCLQYMYKVHTYSLYDLCYFWQYWQRQYQRGCWWFPQPAWRSGTPRQMDGWPGRTKGCPQQCTDFLQSLSRLTTSVPRTICHEYFILNSINIPFDLSLIVLPLFYFSSKNILTEFHWNFLRAKPNCIYPHMDTWHRQKLLINHYSQDQLLRSIRRQSKIQVCYFPWGNHDLEL